MEEKHIDWLVAAICRDFSRYDANEAYADKPTSPRDGDCEGHSDRGIY